LVTKSGEVTGYRISVYEEIIRENSKRNEIEGLKKLNFF